jgi:hypothetical protein
VIAMVVWCLPASAPAKNIKVLSYRFNTIWSTTIRFIRADKGFKITDKDKENGFILFGFNDDTSEQPSTASLELLHIEDEEGYQRIQLQLSIANQPSYIEIHFLDKLEEKLRDERGEPPPPRKIKRPKPKPKPPEEDKPDQQPDQKPDQKEKPS